MEMEAMIDGSTSNYIIPSLRLDDGWFVFSFVSNFLSSITPNDMPLIYCILELLRDAFQSKVSILKIILEALKVESGYICLIVVIFLISILPFCYTIAWCFSRNVKLKVVSGRNDVLQMGSRAVLAGDVDREREKIRDYHCRKRVYVFVFQCFIVLSIICVLAMFIVNEKLSMYVDDTPNVIRSALNDIEFFVRSSHHQVQADIFEHFDKAREKIKIDLEDIDMLLGERITREISIQTGLDVTFESSVELLASTKILSHRVQHLMNEILLKTLMLSADAAAKVDEIHIQLSVLQRQCNYRDRPLCDTLKVKSFDEMGFIDRMKVLNENPILQKLRTMIDGTHENNLKRLSEELSVSKKSFRNYSQLLQHDSKSQRQEVLKQLTIMRNGLNETVNNLSLVVKHVLDKIANIWDRVLPVLNQFRDAGYLNWLVGLVSSTTTLVVTLFLLIPVGCTCCHVDKLAATSFMMSASLLSMFSFFLGIFTIFEVLIGGHGEVFVCRAFYEKPEYTIIGKLFDNPGIIYSNPPVNAALAELLVPSDQSTRQFSNTSLTMALGECERNRSTYETFQIDNLLDLKNILNFENYLDLVRAIQGIRAMESPLHSLTQKLQSILGDLIEDSSGNFTEHRLELMQVSPEKEMINFIDQMQRVSLQIHDSSTASRMATLASSARRVQSTILKPLEVLKNEIVFQLTALELHIDPWIKKVKESKDNFNQSQKYIDNYATDICANFSENFRDRLRTNLAVLRNETVEHVKRDFGCKPLFDIFNGIRWLLCGHIVEPINGLFFLSFVILCIWMASTPISLSLASAYDKIETVQQQFYRANNAHQRNDNGSNEIVNRDTSWSSRPRTAIDSPQINRTNWLSYESSRVVEESVELDSPPQRVTRAREHREMQS